MCEFVFYLTFMCNYSTDCDDDGDPVAATVVVADCDDDTDNVER